MSTAVTAPNWLNKDFLLYTLNGSVDKTDYVLHSFEMLPLDFAPGDANCSCMYAVKVLYRDKDKSDIKARRYIIKRPLESSQLLDIVEESKFVEREYIIYNEYFTLVEKIVGDLGFITKHFPCKDHNTLVLEDLKIQGYRMCDKYKQLDLDHCIVALKSLAAYHAASVVVCKQNPEFVGNLNKLGSALLTKEGSPGFQALKALLNNFIKFVEDCSEIEYLVPIAQRLLDSFYKNVKQVYFRSTSMKVMNHGDAWTNNMLFKYDENGKIESIKFVDLQMSHYGSIGIDLHYFTWVAMEASLRDNRLNELYGIYLKTLNKCLEKFGSEERMSQEQFDEEINSTASHAFFAVGGPLYVIVAASGQLNAEYRQNNSSCVNVYDLYKNTSEKCLLYLERMGL